MAWVNSKILKIDYIYTILITYKNNFNIFVIYSNEGRIILVLVKFRKKKNYCSSFKIITVYFLKQFKTLWVVHSFCTSDENSYRANILVNKSVTNWNSSIKTNNPTQWIYVLQGRYSSSDQFSAWYSWYI